MSLVPCTPLNVRSGAHWDAGNAAHAGQSSAGFCDSHVSICQRELRGKAGQHSSASAFACATQCSGHSFATQPTQGRAVHVFVIHTFEYVSASWEVEQGSTVLHLLSPAQIHLNLIKRSIALNTYLYAFVILRYNFANISAIESKPHPIFRYAKMATKVRLRIEEIR